ncbi:hypothetical protein ZEAMMB73_Zm00001d049498 [Zea mays]|uniref:Uncharacterized protein n=2 Tax=Zea mays TaxID=4577 RepID=A0A1D6PVR6_MAIZE|nr:hypothetical protein ZEAMMB73_Zm00001d049498 [Zea mays]
MAPCTAFPRPCFPPSAQKLLGPTSARSTSMAPAAAPLFMVASPCSPFAPLRSSSALHLPWTPRNSSSEPPSSLFVMVPAGCSTKCAANRALQQPSRSISTPLVVCRRSRARCAAPSATPSKTVLAVNCHSSRTRVRYKTGWVNHVLAQLNSDPAQVD